MSKKVANGFGKLLLLLLSVLGVRGAFGQPGTAPTKVVKRIYAAPNGGLTVDAEINMPTGANSGQVKIKAVV